jgi:hypothetical protein
MKKKKILSFCFVILFGCNLILAQSVRLSAKVFLSHVNLPSLLMDDYLKNTPSFPLTDPYSNTGAFNGNYTHVNNSNIATLLPSKLAITGNGSVVDWVFVELRQGTSGATTVTTTQAGIVRADGIIVDTDMASPLQFSNTPPDNYFVTIRHRNHLGFRTLNAIPLSNTVTVLNFTNNSVLLFGATPLIPLSSNVSVMVGGDSNSDGSIDAFDSIYWELQNGLFDDYTNNADYNSDGSIDAFDTIIWEINSGKFQDLD